MNASKQVVQVLPRPAGSSGLSETGPTTKGTIEVNLHTETCHATTYAGYYSDLAGRIPDGGLWIEVGILHGVGLVHAATECRRLGKHRVRFIGVDRLHLDGLAPQPPGEWLERLMTNLTANGLFPHPVSVFLGLSTAAAKALRGLQADVVFIDASHDYHSVLADIDAWKWIVKSGGILCGHDYDKTWPGVIQAVDERLPDRTIKFCNCWEVTMA